MRILVTGGAGFIGSHIVDAYVAAGHEVWVIDDESSGNRKQVNPKAKYIRANLLDLKSLKKIFKAGRFDVVNHHAAQIDVRRSVADPVFDARINIIGILNLLNLSRDNKVKKFLFASSGGTIYGECARPATESFPEEPLSPYGIAKLASEKYIKAYASLYGIDYTIFRYSNVYGPRQNPHGEAGVVAIFSERLLNGEPLTIFGDGKQTRDFVFVVDIARANVMALEKGNNQIVNIGIQREISVNELFREMAALTGYKLRPIYKKARPGELRRSVLNIAHARRALGWKPSVTFREGLRQTIGYFTK